MSLIWINTGELSGDMQAATLLQALRQHDPSLKAIGMGGEQLAEAGQTNLFDIHELSVMGFVEVFSALPRAWRLLRQIKQALKRHRPQAVVLVDAPEFNFRVAAIAARLGIPVYYFIPPKVWAWRQGRVRFLKKHIQKLLCILPFEEAFYSRQELNVTYVGNPLLDLIHKADVEDITPIEGRIGLMPGSRLNEVQTLMPLFAATAQKLARHHNRLSFHCICAPNISTQLLRNLWTSSVPLHIEPPKTRYKFLRSCQCVVAASGTAVLETALLGTPTVITYKVSPVTWFVGKWLVRVPWVGLPNLIAGREVFPELLQAKATPEHLANKVSQWLAEPALLAAVRREAAEVQRLCGEPGSADRAAQIILQDMNK